MINQQFLLYVERIVLHYMGQVQLLIPQQQQQKIKFVNTYRNQMIQVPICW
jgi:hypothetical protein